MLKVKNKLKGILQEKQMTQTALAKSLGTTDQKVSRLVKADRFTLEDLQNLCNALQKTPNDIMLEDAPGLFSGSGEGEGSK
jgi:DNA-binding Xre family transcriptional regulator